jgi:hypothetical protein
VESMAHYQSNQGKQKSLALYSCSTILLSNIRCFGCYQLDFDTRNFLSVNFSSNDCLRFASGELQGIEKHSPK